MALPVDTNTPMPRRRLSESASRALRQAVAGSSATTNIIHGGGDTATNYPRPGDLFLHFNILEKIGEGGFGTVFLAEEVKLGGRHVVLKFTNRANKEPERLASLQHANVVPVYSVHSVPPVQVLCMPYLGRQTLQDVVDHVTSTRCRTQTMPISGTALLSCEPTRLCETGPVSKWKSRTKPKSSFRNAFDPEPVPVAANSPAPQPIRDRLQKLSFKESVVWLFTRLAEGLQHAHERGILHLDMKPSNILMSDDGVPMILDFGLAYDTKSGNYDQTGGTPRYMAPEQVIGYAKPGTVAPDARMDLYALGLMFFELLTGVHPFEETSAPGTPMQRMLDARKCAPVHPRTLNANIDPAVEAIVMKLLQPDPEKRYQKAEDLVTDLVLHQENRPVKFAGNPSVWERVKKMRRRHPILAVAMIAGMFALSTTGAVATAAHEIRQRSQRDAMLQARDFHETVKNSRTDLTTMDRAEDRKTAIRHAKSALGVYDVQSQDWQLQPGVEHLNTDERKQLHRDLVELAALLAHAHRLNALFENGTAKANSYDQALNFNELAARLNRGLPHLAALEVQREELMSLAKLSDEEPRKNVPMVEPLDHYLTGLSGMASGQYGAAVDAFKALLDQSPEHSAGQLALGWVYQYQGKFVEASEHFQLAKVLSPKDPRPAFNRGVLLQFHRKYPAAIEEFNNAVARNPKFATTYYYRAMTLRKLGKLEEAIADCGRAIDGKEMVYASLLLRAELYDETNKPVAAAQDRAVVSGHEPKTESEFFARGRSKLAADPKAALDDFNKALDLNPRYLTAWMHKAQVLNERLNQPKAALEAYDRVMELHPRSAPTMAAQAVILARLNDKTAALKKLEAVALLADDANVWFDCARAYAAAGEREQAVSSIRRAFREGFADFKKVAAATELDSVRSMVSFQQAVNAAKTLQTR